MVDNGNNLSSLTVKLHHWWVKGEFLDDKFLFRHNFKVLQVDVLGRSIEGRHWVSRSLLRKMFNTVGGITVEDLPNDNEEDSTSSTSYQEGRVK